ncbi:MAG: DUF2939 domain-containing protein [Phenylobacterium sp.]|nr:DUF2939 domain-containing protein [Phenylobacterium sp.]
MLRTPIMLALASILGLGLAGCGGSAPKGAVDSAGRLLSAAVAGDRAAFEAEIDRAAIREDLRRQVNAMARTSALEVDGGPSEFALDRMIGPDAVRLVGPDGELLREAPTTRELSRQMRVIDRDHVCVQRAVSPRDCVLTFGRGPEGWRLVGMRAMDRTIEVVGLAG